MQHIKILKYICIKTLQIQDSSAKLFLTKATLVKKGYTYMMETNEWLLSYSE